MMVNKNKIILMLPMFPAEETVVWFWSGINIVKDKTYRNYVDYLKFYREKMCNQS
jgi:hypothetical protein